MRTEVQLPNPKGELLLGMYATVHFDFKRKEAPILIPADTLVASPSGDRVVLVRNGVAHFQAIRVGTDYGAQLEGLDGIKVGDSLVENVTDVVRDGERLSVVAASSRSDK